MKLSEPATITPLKILGWIAILILVVNIIMFATGRIGNLVFWMVILIGAFVGYIVVPRLRRPEY